MAPIRTNRASQIDKLAEIMDPRLSERSPLTKSTVVLVASSLSSGKVRFSILRRVSVSEERQFQSARSFSQRLQVERSLCQKVRSYSEEIGCFANISKVFSGSF
jgi:hypothetical protein